MLPNKDSSFVSWRFYASSRWLRLNLDHLVTFNRVFFFLTSIRKLIKEIARQSRLSHALLHVGVVGSRPRLVVSDVVMPQDVSRYSETAEESA